MKVVKKRMLEEKKSCPIIKGGPKVFTALKTFEKLQLQSVDCIINDKVGPFKHLNIV